MNIPASEPRSSRPPSSSGQSMVETALVLPLLLVIALNAINFGYFFVIAVNLTAAPRSGAEYSIQGFSTPSAISLPSAGPSTSVTSVSYLTYRDMTGALYAPATNGSIRVCSQTVGLNSDGTVMCASYGSPATYPAVVADPERIGGAGTPPAFALHVVDVVYRFSPLIPGSPFNIVLLASPICSSSNGSASCQFHRQALMRAMN